MKMRDDAPRGDVDSNVIMMTLWPWGAMATHVGARIEELVTAGGIASNHCRQGRENWRIHGPIHKRRAAQRSPA